jgi:hypothetical protein
MPPPNVLVKAIAPIKQSDVPTPIAVQMGVHNTPDRATRGRKTIGARYETQSPPVHHIDPGNVIGLSPKLTGLHSVPDAMIRLRNLEIPK